MFPRSRALVLTLAAWALPAAARAATTVTFVAPQNYTDGNLAWSNVDQRLTFEGLERIFTRLAAQRLPAGDDLHVEVLNLDLAGKIDPLRSRTGTLRVMREDTWPSMTLRYTLRRKGRLIAKGEETIRVMNYLMDPVAIRSVEPLRFEKAMIDKWLRTRFAAAS